MLANFEYGIMKQILRDFILVHNVFTKESNLFPISIIHV